MKVSGTLSGFNNSIVDMNVYIDNPYSGFELTAMETGNGTRYNRRTYIRRRKTMEFRRIKCKRSYQ